MGKSAPSPPPAPDPTVTAAAQTASNDTTARLNAQLNRVNQVGPDGSVTYKNDGDNWTETTALSPGQQQNYNLATQAQGIYGNAAVDQLSQAKSTLSSPFTLNNLPASGPDSLQGPQLQSAPLGPVGQVQTGIAPGGHIQGSVADPSQFAGQSQALQQSILQRLQPQMQNQTQQADASLRNQGLTPGTEAYDNAMRSVNQSQNDLRLGAVSTADQEQQQLYGMGLSSGQFANAAQNQQYGQNANNAQFANSAQDQQYQQAASNASLFNTSQQQDFANQATAGSYADQQRQQALQQQLLARQEPVNEAAALLTGQQVQQPGFLNVPQTQVAPTDVLGAYQMQQNALTAAYQAKNQNYMAQLGGMYQLGSAVIGGASKAYSGGM